MSARGRYSYAQAILGKDAFERVQTTKLLCVGAGGMYARSQFSKPISQLLIYALHSGCEVLKNLVQVGFGDITIIDLDTIDLSNLNRQFLFQKQHVKRPKALVARETALRFNPAISIKAVHGNVKEPQYDIDWYKEFDLVINALDNIGECFYGSGACDNAR